MSQYESFHLWGEGRFCYDDEKVNRSKDLIKDAEKALDSTKENIAKGFSSLLAAANIETSGLAENIRSNEPVITKFPEDCVSYMEELYKMVQSKQDEIENYKNASGWDKFWSTVGMAGSKVLEGIASVGENIIDAGATLVGCVGGIFSSDFQDSCAEFIKKDHVGEAFHNFNEATGLTKYSAMSENGTMAKIFKGIGVATGYVAVAALTGGTVNAIAGAGTMTATAANTAVAVVGGLGSGMESGLQQGKDWNGALGEGVKTAAIQGATAYAAGKLSEHIQTNKALKTSAADQVDDAIKTTNKAKEGVLKAKDNLAKTAVKDKEAYKAAKSALKEAKIDYHTARANQALVEKGAIAGNVDKYADKIAKNTAKGDKLIENISVKDPSGKLISRTATRTSNIAKAVEGHVGNKISTVAGNATDAAINKVSTKVDAIATKAGNTGIGKAATSFVENHPKITTAVKLPVDAAVGATKTVVKSGDILTIKNDMAKMDNNVIAAHNRQIEAVDKAAEQHIGNYPNYDGITGDDISNIMGGSTQNSTYTPVNESGYVDQSSGTSYSSTSDSGYTAYQPSVAARVASSGGGYTSSGGGSTYTPTYTATASSPSIQTADVATTTSPLSDRTYTTTDLSNTTPSSSTSGGSTGNSNAVIDTFNNSTGGSTSGGNTSTYTYDEPVRSTTSYSSSGTTHSGGGYSSSGYSFGGSDVGSYSDTATSIDPTDLITEDTSMSSTSGTLASSITSTNKFSNQTIKIPTSSEAVTSSSSNMAIPTAAAFSAAAAAGIGAKAFLDKKQREKEESDEVFGEGSENSGIYSDNWEGSEDDIKVDYGAEEDETLDDDNSYSADSIIEKYEAVSNEELEEA